MTLVRTREQLPHPGSGCPRSRSWSSLHAFDSLSPWRSHHVTNATTNRCAKMSRLPSRPSGTTSDGQREADHRADRPGELRRADVLGPILGGRLLGDVGPRRRHARPHREAGDHEGQEQHPVADREDGQEHADHVEQQVVGVDELAAVAVAQPATDQRPACGAERVRTEGRQQSHGEVVDPELLLPQGEADGDRDDRARLDVVRHRHRDRGVPPGRLTGSECHAQRGTRP